MSKWREIRCDFFNEEEERYYVDAWKTGNDNEEGKVIAKIDLANGTVEYLDEDARTDEDAQVVINEFLENGYVLTEQSLNNDFMRESEEMIMAKYTQTVDEFYESLTQSWTWKRLTEEEKKKFNNMNVLNRLKGTNNQRIDSLNLIYHAFLLGLGYDSPNWRD